MWREIIFKLPIVDNINEFLLIKYLIHRQNEIDPFRDYPYIFAYEFPLDPEMTNVGKIDLILVDPAGEDPRFLIVEVKYLQRKSGKTSRTSRTKKRRKVEEQAQIYAERFASMYPEAQVNSVYFTNENFSSQREMNQLYNQFILKEWEKIYEMYPNLKERDVRDKDYLDNNDVML